MKTGLAVARRLKSERRLTLREISNSRFYCKAIANVIKIELSPKEIFSILRKLDSVISSS